MHGVIWKPGETAPIHLDRYELRTDYAGEPAPSATIGWTFEGGGDAISIDGRVLGYMPLRVGKSPVRIAQMIVELDGETPGYATTDLTRPIAGD
jgi:hypothetical protein